MESELIHGLIKPLESELFIDTRYEQDIEIRWMVADSALVDHKSGILRILVKKQEDND